MKSLITRLVTLLLVFCLIPSTIVFAGDLEQTENQMILNDNLLREDAQDQEIVLESISLNYSKKTLNRGDKLNLVVAFAPEEAGQNAKVTWASSDQAVAAVSAKGVVTAKKPGKAVITAAVGDLTAKCVITVKAPLQSIYLNATSRIIKIGNKFQLKVGYIPSYTTSGKTVKWTSSNKTVASINSNGLVTARKAGVALITAKVGQKKAFCTITVKPKFEQTDSSYKNVKTGSSGTYPEYRRITTSHAALKYTYEVTPLLPPFNDLVFVKTGNPDPLSFRLVDKNAKKDGDDYTPAFLPCKQKFVDVKYENEKILRVNGGYIFKSDRWTSEPDGGNLTLQVVNMGYEDSAWCEYSGGGMSFRGGDENKIYSDTNVKVKCQKLKNYIDFIVDKYTDKSKGLFENLDAVQAVLDKAAVYPKAVVDSSKRKTSMPYPALATSPYVELSLNSHYEIFESAGALLLSWLYPFVLSSASFPGTMSAVAKKLEPNCKVESDSMHWLIKVTYKGKTKTYGGAGYGSTNEIYSSDVKKTYTFRGGENDFASGVGMGTMSKKLIEYGDKGDEKIAIIQNKYDLSSSGLAKKVGKGAWIKVMQEGLFSAGVDISYVMPYKDYKNWAYPVNDIWIDGRYVNDHEAWDVGAKFKDHPTASILVKNVTYKDYMGVSHTEHMKYDYDSFLKKWSAEWYFTRGYSYQGMPETPEKFFLTLEQVKAMKPDRNTNTIPNTVLIYDGSAAPGTKEKNIPVKSVKLNKETAKVGVGDSISLKATISPKNATYQDYYWTSSNTEVATVDESGFVHGVKEGTVVITVTTLEGRKTAKCKVTVTKAVKKTELTYGDVVIAAYAKNPNHRFYYTGKVIKPAVIVRHGGKKLVEGKDYTLRYDAYYGNGDMTMPGVYYAFVSGIGAYTGYINCYYWIELKVPEVQASIVSNKNGSVKIKWK